LKKIEKTFLPTQQSTQNLFEKSGKNFTQNQSNLTDRISQNVNDNNTDLINASDSGLPNMTQSNPRNGRRKLRPNNLKTWHDAQLAERMQNKREIGSDGIDGDVLNDNVTLKNDRIDGNAMEQNNDEKIGDKNGDKIGDKNGDEILLSKNEQNDEIEHFSTESGPVKRSRQRSSKGNTIKSNWNEDSEENRENNQNGDGVDQNDQNDEKSHKIHETGQISSQQSNSEDSDNYSTNAPNKRSRRGRGGNEDGNVPVSIGKIAE